MAAVMSRPFPGRERSLLSFNAKRPLLHSKSPQVRSPKSVLQPESPLDSSSESSSLASSTLGSEQIVECTSFRNASRIINESHIHSKPVVPESSFEQVDSYTWFVSIDRPSDLLVEVDEICFHLHKLPLLPRSGLLFRLASQSCDSRKAYVNLVDFPGGPEAFISVAKFCYGIVEELTPTNVATIRCAAEYLEMTEAFEEGNLLTKADAYLDLVILNSWQESIIVLQSCELLLPWAEDMNLVRRCAQSVALKAGTDPRGVRWLFSGIEKTSTVARNSLEGSVARVAPKDWWYEDVSHLTIYCFSQVVDAIKETGMHPALLGGALEYYAQRWLPGLVKPAVDSTVTSSKPSTRKTSPTSSPREDNNNTRLLLTNCHESKGASPGAVHESNAEQNRNRFILEEIATMLPPQKDAVSCSFALRMTRAAYMLNCDLECKAELERRAGLVLDHALLADLLIPCFSHTSEYLYDVNLVRRILDHFLTQSEQSVTLTSRAKVAKLLDAYLAEVARDSKLPISKFQFLADALPEGSRSCDDGLYRAVDTYLKIHPTLAEHERKRLCRLLNCHRFSLDACVHASQNERLPLRFVVQVLFCEQQKIRSTVSEVCNNSVKADCRCNADNVSVVPSREPTADESSQPAASSTQSPGTQSGTQSGTQFETRSESPDVQESINQMEIRALQRELATMRIKCNDLERDHGTIQDQVEQISRISRGGSTSSWSSGAWRKISKLHLFGSHKESTPVDSSRTDESRTTNPRRWRNSIS